MRYTVRILILLALGAVAIATLASYPSGATGDPRVPADPTAGVPAPGGYGR